MRVPRNDRLASLRQLGVGCSRRVTGDGLVRTSRHADLVPSRNQDGGRLAHARVIPDLLRDPTIRRRCRSPLQSQRTWRHGSRIKSGMTVSAAGRSCAATEGVLSSPTERRQADRWTKIVPKRVVSLDQLDLPVAAPAFEALFGHDRCGHRVGRIVPNESLDLVAISEASKRTFAMLNDATEQVGCHADVQRAQIAAGHHVHARLPVPHAAVCAARWTPAQGRGDDSPRDVLVEGAGA
ncbi:hypothetical protein SAMN05428950_102141 [Sphingomonas sp. OV641]|nr:hypothetical protein SAMN05428950_102141 [Sphingomonas sp. OV641]